MTTHYPHIVRAVQETPWALLEETLSAIVEVIQLRAGGERFSPDELSARLVARRAEPAAPTLAGDIAVLPLHGVLSQRMNLMTEMSGGTSTEKFTGLLQSALADPAVGVVLLDVDSPGGSVFGIQELANVMHANRGGKPIIAVANSLAASAAYWLASQADEVVMTPGGQVGSIGVLRIHEDLSKLAEMKGVKVTYITAGRHKAEDAAFAPLSDEARAAMQTTVDGYYRAFVGAVARGRGVSDARVEAQFGQGRVFGAEEAQARGMVDRIATLAETIARYRQPGAIVALRTAARLRALAATDPAAALQARRQRAEALRRQPVTLPVLPPPERAAPPPAPAPALATPWRGAEGR